ncbi:MAG: hypothetical protein WEA82_09610 [Idiomarina sp.]
MSDTSSSAVAAKPDNASDQEADVFSRLRGHWDDLHPNACRDSHQLSFNDDRTKMYIKSDDGGWVTEDDKRNVFSYDILSVHPNRLRTQLENEPRLDGEGESVVWHIILLDDNTHCWGRDDWHPRSCTPPRMRCPG